MQAERARRWQKLAAPAGACLAIAHRRTVERPHHIGIYWRARIVHASEDGVRAEPLGAFALRYGLPEYGNLKADGA
jgi:hypothetical protein